MSIFYTINGRVGVVTATQNNGHLSFMCPTCKQLLGLNIKDGQLQHKHNSRPYCTFSLSIQGEKRARFLLQAA